MGCDRKIVLVVDDEPAVAESHASILTELGYDARIELNPLRVEARVVQDGVALVLLDLRMPTRDGISVLRDLRVRYPQIGVVIATVVNDIEYAVSAIKSGAYNYLLKPITQNRLAEILNSYFSNQSRALVGGELFRSYLTQDVKFEEIFRRVKSFAEAGVSVLINGETGTGKELIAQLIHSLGHQNSEPFVPVNVAAIPEDIFESEMFGHAKGSFTGAVKDKVGYCEVAKEGALFFDEIGELSLSSQKKLLRVLQSRQFSRVGETTPRSLHARLIFATNQNLSELCRADKFREDLYFRLSSHMVTLPPLRERLGDVEVLCRYFFLKYCSQYGRQIEEIASETFEALNAYGFPGNIRELEGIISSAVLLEQGRTLQVSSLPLHVRRQEPRYEGNTQLSDVKYHAIFNALNECNGNQTRAAQKLGIARETLNRLLKSYRALSMPPTR